SPLACWLYTFILVMLAWVFFRANSIGDAILILDRILSLETFTGLPLAIQQSFRGVAAIGFLFVVEYLQRTNEHPLQIERVPAPVQFVGYLGMVFVVVRYGALDETPFIYFQF
ncbi:MAG: hypothetical protein OEM91_12095, partial [Hyphomicrobiales bacterium]|nr:hypothetical protein [Hyphomicrobiales bacterium]